MRPSYGCGSPRRVAAVAMDAATSARGQTITVVVVPLDASDAMSDADSYGDHAAAARNNAAAARNNAAAAARNNAAAAINNTAAASSSTSILVGAGGAAKPAPRRQSPLSSQRAQHPKQ